MGEENDQVNNHKTKPCPLCPEAFFQDKHFETSPAENHGALRKEFKVSRALTWFPHQILQTLLWEWVVFP